MTKVLCEVTLKDDLGKNHTFKCCGFTLQNAEEKLLKQFYPDKIVKSRVLYEYDEEDYGWV